MHYIKGNNEIYVYAMLVLDSRMYIIINDQKKNEALIVDPLIHEDAIPILKKLSYATILLTHSHYDHISGVNWIKKQISCNVLCSDICAKKIKNSTKNLSTFSQVLVMGKSEEEQAIAAEFMEVDYTCEADQTFETETSFEFGSYHVDIIHTPGHSTCSQCIKLTTNKESLLPEIVFTGDSLVNGHDIITRLPDGSKRDYKAITKPILDAISNDTMIMPGHGNWGKKHEI